MLFRHGGEATKEIALRVPIDSPPPNRHRTTLLHVILRWLELATSHTPAAAVARSAGDMPAQGPATLSAAIGVGNLGAVPATIDNARGAAAGAAGEGEDREGVEAIAIAVADGALSLLRLMCRWLHDCPAAARELLENPANLFVVDVAAGRCSLLSSGGVTAEGARGGNSAETRKNSGGGFGAAEGRRTGGGAGVSAAAVHGGCGDVQRTTVKGLACLVLGLLLEFVERGVSSARSSGSISAGSGGGGGGVGEEEGWTRELVMKMIQNRVGEWLENFWSTTSGAV